MPLLDFANLNFELPEDWVDITADLPPGSAQTLAREGGIGALQFTTTRHDGTPRPPIGTSQLRDFLTDFCIKNTLAPSEIRIVRVGKLMSASTESRKPDEQVAAWYVTDGKNLALISYTSLEPANPKTAEELAEIQAMIPTILFG